MQILNYLYFAIFLYLCAKSVGQKSPILTYSTGGVKRVFEASRGEGLIYFLIVTSIFAFYSPGLIDLAAIRLLSMLVILLFMLIFWGRGVRFTAGIVLYILFLVWVCIGSVSSDYSTAYAVRAMLKYSYPLLLLFVTSTFIKDGWLVLKISQTLRRVALFSLVILFIPYSYILFSGLFYYGTAICIHYISISAISLATYIFIDRRWWNLCLALLFMLPCVIWSYRTSILANIVMLSVFAVFIYRLRAIVVLLVIAAAAIATVFCIPAIKQKMFIGSESISIQDLQDGNLSIDMINSNGRFAMWRDLMSRFYGDKKLIGSGTGTIQGYMYDNTVFGGLKTPHNDYVTIICDNGLIGLALYLSAYLCVLLQCYAEFIRRRSSKMVRYCAIIAASTISAVLVTMYTDNSLNYSVATWSCPIAFYGMMLALKWNQKHRVI